MYKLLIVEDERKEREGLLSFLDWQSLGFEIVGTAADGIEGISAAMETRPDIIITDIKMPGIDGLKMISNIQKFLPDIKTIFLSGYHNFNFAREAIGLKAYGYVLKPVRREDLLELLGKIMTDFDEQKRKRELEDSMKSQLNLSSSMMKRKFLLELAEGKLDNNEIITMAAQYILDFRQKLFAAIAFKIDDDQNGEMLNASGENRTLCAQIISCVTNILGEEGWVVQSEQAVNEFYICLPLDIPNDANAGFSNELLKRKSHNILNIIREQLGINVIIGVGGKTGRIYEIPESYIQAKRALELFFFDNNRHVFYYEDAISSQYLYDRRKQEINIKSDHYIKEIIICIVLQFVLY